MKIGILTFHCAHNFGAVLQCYALQEVLKMMNHEVEILNYRPQYLATSYPKVRLSTFKCKSPLKLYNRITVLIPQLRKKYKLYTKFENDYYQLSPQINNKDQFLNIANKYQYIIIGSDQVWNTKYNHNEMLWFGDFGKALKDTKLIAYAASAGDPSFSIEELQKISLYINAFKSISVREHELKKTLSPYIKQNIQCVLDPTLMAPPSIWKRFQNIIINEKDPYILIYQARKDNNVFRIAKQISKQKHWKIITIDFYDNSIGIRNGIYHRTISPDQFVSYVKNAQCVITTSFHGTVFSIINKTPFYTLKLNDGADARNEELLNLLNLRDRFIEKNLDIKFISIKFDISDQLLENLRIKSFNFLKSALS